MSRGRLIGGAAAGVAVIAAVAVVARAGGEAEPSAAASQATQTTTIRQQDLVEREQVDGTLGYSDARTVLNRLAGTLTWAPKVGSVVQTNQRLYEVDGSAVYLLHGDFPAYRAMGPGVGGQDVGQLESNLRRLGLDGDREMTVDGSWDAGTTAAVLRWQARKGIVQSGTIELGRIVFAPSARRIGALSLAVGASLSGTGSGSAASGGATPSGGGGGEVVMATTSTKRIVTVDLVTTKQSLAKQGAGVTVELPGGETARGTIVRVGRVAQKKVTAQDDDPPATIKLIIKLASSKGTKLDQAPVDVQLERSRAKNALTVPVTALLARAGGEFAVEIRDGDERRVVAVKPGLYTDRFVEIDGRGLRPGMTVTDAGV